MVMQNKALISTLLWLIKRQYATNMHSSEQLVGGWYGYLHLKCNHIYIYIMCFNLWALGIEWWRTCRRGRFSHRQHVCQHGIQVFQQSNQSSPPPVNTKSKDILHIGARANLTQRLRVLLNVLNSNAGTLNASNSS